MTLPHRRSLLAGLAVLALGLTACGGDGTTGTPSGSAGGSQSAAPSETGADLTGSLTVFGAASLTDVFTGLGADFMAANPGLEVVFNFAGSSTLAEQITSGAPADVFASASPTTMQTVVDGGGAAGEPVVFTSNTLQIAVPTGNPAGISGLADLANPDLTIALCAPEVPCGAAAVKVFEAAGLTAAPDTLEQDVTAVLTKIEGGDVDAGLVYRTDVLGSDMVVGLDFPEAAEAVNDYPIVVLTEAPNPDAAAAWVEFIEGDEGQQALTDAGFQTP